MRVLLTDHFPLSASSSGKHCRLLAAGLQQAGHEVRVITVADGPQPVESFPLRVVVCRADARQAALPFTLPGFTLAAPAGVLFADLTDEQLAAYREELRRQIDVEIAQFNPHVMHSQHVWIEGQLALETGVPYVLTAWGAELACLESDPRYRTLAEQAAENASRIVVGQESLASRLAATFDSISERVLVVPEIATTQGSSASERMADIYRAVFQQRFGTPPT
jgi:hypothetical protein